MRAHTRTTLLLAAALASASLLAQQAPAVFRSSTQYVTVDAVVTKDDVPVTDLTKDDFEITENGKKQTIADFEFVSVPLAHRTIDVDAPKTPGGADVPAAPSDVASNGDSARASRGIVVLVDDSSLSAVLSCLECPDVMVSLKNALVQFLQSLSPNDQVAMVWQSRSDLSQDFTNDIPRLISMVKSRKAAMGLPGMPHAWRAPTFSLEFAIQALAGSRFARRAIVFVGVSACHPTSMNPDGEGEECRRMYQMARNANVPIYALDPRVLPPVGPITESPLKDLANNTGGLAFTQQSRPLWAVDQILADNGSFYTLGFYPEPLVLDGKYHDIKVAVKRPGMRVRSRSNYLADTAARIETTPKASMDKTLAAGTDDPSLPLRATVAPLQALPRGGMRALITLEVAYPLPESGQLDDELRVGLVALTPDAKVRTSFQRPIQISGRIAPTSRGTLLINEALDLPSEHLTIRAGVTSRALSKSGTVHLTLDVPDPRGSNLVLTPLVFGNGALVEAIGGIASLDGFVDFQPTTARTFTANEPLRVMARAFWAGADTALPVTIRVAGASEWRQDMTAAAGVSVNGRRQGDIEFTIPAGRLTAGPHTLVVEARPRKGKPVSRAVPFEIR